MKAGVGFASLAALQTRTFAASQQKPLRVALIGARGKMGRFTRDLLTAEGDFDVVSEIHRGDDLRAALEAARPEVGLDFTVAGRGAEHGLAMLACGVRPLIGTSGLSAEDDARLDAAARERSLGGLVVPNFCLGVWLLQRLALDAQRFLPALEIVEEHKHTKQDAPSGTALDTAAQLAAARGIDPAEIPIHSVRLPGLYSNHTLLFGGSGEVLRITHETSGLDAFAPGILAGLRYAAQAEGVQRGIGPAFERGTGHLDMRPAPGKYGIGDDV